MAIVQEINLNMIPDSAPVIVHVNQYDEGEGRFEIHLFDGNVPYVPAAGAEAIIQGTKPDGKGFDYNATLSGSTVTADVTKQMTAVAGVVRVQVVITEGDDVTGTFVFGMDVQKSGLPADTDMSASEYQVVMQLLETAEGINNNPPKIGVNGHWWVWDASTGAYVDSGVDASISVEIADITMLEPDATPYVENTGTDTDPIFHLFIPRGQTGTGISSISKTGTSGYVDTYTVTYTDGSTSQFEITNGRNTDQVTTIPTASAELVGTIYQYIGESTSSYTHGFYYECVNDGGVYKWVNIPVGNDPVAITSTDPYTYRQSKGNLADMEIVGASVGWNQHIPNRSTTTRNGITFTVDNTAHTITISGTASANAQLEFYSDSSAGRFKATQDHIYLYYVKNEGISASNITFRFLTNSTFSNANTLTSAKNYSIAKCNDASYGAGLLLRVTSGTDCTTPVKVNYPNFIDLTLLFGSTIADAIYAMEQATAGAGVAFFRKYFPKDYYAYDAGSIQSVCVGSRKVVGFNQWDEQWEVGAYSDTDGSKITSNQNIRCKNPINCLPNTNYYYKSGATNQGRICFYNKNGEFISTTTNVDTVITTPENCYYITLNTRNTYGNVYKNDICINISDPSKNGTYEPYIESSYPFDSTKELRGMFDLVNGELKANGDVWRGNKIQRNWDIIDLGTLDYTYSSENQRFLASLSAMVQAGARRTPLVCSKYVCLSNGETYSDVWDKVIYASSGTIYIHDHSYTDAATFKTAMSGVYIVYPLATPTTESAQPYQNPQRAYIDGTEEFTDGLTRDVMIPVGNNTTYQQDKILPSVEDYVDSITDTKADISAIASEENGATASKAYTTGQHFYKDGKFCTAIANIASNAAFTLNTNYVEGTIAEALEAINVSGGHTIVNSSGSSMTARSKLKFANATVTDDPANDQTVITTNPASTVQTATLDSNNFIKDSSDSGVYYITRSGFCEVHIKTIKPKNTGQGLLVATGLPQSANEDIIMGNTPNFEDGTAFYINTINNTTSLYALIPDTGVKSGCVLYMMK